MVEKYTFVFFSRSKKKLRADNIFSGLGVLQMSFFFFLNKRVQGRLSPRLRHIPQTQIASNKDQTEIEPQPTTRHLLTSSKLEDINKFQMSLITHQVPTKQAFAQALNLMRASFVFQKFIYVSIRKNSHESKLWPSSRF